MRFNSRLKMVWPMRGAVTAALAVALLALACTTGGEEAEGPSSGIVVTLVTPQPTPTATPTPAPTPTPTPTPVPNVCPPPPDAATAAEMQVQEPPPLAQVKSPFHVRGWGSNIARTGVVVAIVDARGEVREIEDAPALPKQGRIVPPGLAETDMTAPFAADMKFTVEEAEAVCLWVFVFDAEGKPMDAVLVPLVLTP